MLRALVSHSMLYTVPTLVARGLSLILLPLYTRVLSPADYGALDLLLVFGNLVILTLALEVSQGFAWAFANERDPESRIAYASTAFCFTVCCYLPFTVLGLVYADALTGLVMGRNDLASEFRIGVVYISLNALFLLVQNQLRWELRSRDFAATSLIMSLTSAGLGVWLTLAFDLGLGGLLWGLGIGALVGALWGLSKLGMKPRWQLDRALLRKMLRYSIPLVPSGIAVLGSIYLDRWLIAYFLTPTDVGLYGLACRIASVVGLALVGIQGALTPLVFTHHREPGTPGELARIFRLVVAVALLICLALTLASDEILSWMAPVEYRSAGNLLALLAPAIVISQLSVFAPGIWIAGKTHLVLWINVGGFVVNIAVCATLIPLIGLTGAALGLLCAQLAVFCAYVFVGQSLYRVPHNGWSLALASVLVSSLGPAFNAIGATGATRMGLSMLVMTVAVLLLLGLRALRVNDLRLLWDAVRGNRGASHRDAIVAKSRPGDAHSG